MFHKIPASKKSLSHRSLVCGVGINDAWYATGQKVDGKQLMCPAYSKWKCMLQRCYNAKCQEKHPTYKGCIVCTEWLTFSVFAEWFELNNTEGYEMDKDIKTKGNKVYCPNMCLFVPSCVNSLLVDSAASRGCHPQGVSFHKQSGNFQASIRIDGKGRHLGEFITSELASKAYIKAKNAEITRKCEQYPEFAKYLINHLM